MGKLTFILALSFLVAPVLAETSTTKPTTQPMLVPIDLKSLREFASLMEWSLETFHWMRYNEDRWGAEPDKNLKQFKEALPLTRFHAIKVVPHSADDNTYLEMWKSLVGMTDEFQASLPDFEQLVKLHDQFMGLGEESESETPDEKLLRSVMSKKLHSQVMSFIAGRMISDVTLDELDIRMGDLRARLSKMENDPPDK